MAIRKAVSTDARELAVVHVDSWRSTYRGIVADNFLETMNYDDREARWRSTLDAIDAIGSENAKRVVFAAEDHDGRIVGFAMGGPHRDPDPEYTGELYAIYLLAEHQGKGLGRMLVKSVAHGLAAQGFQSMLVWVLAQNPSRYFYERLGGVHIRSKQAEIGSQSLPELAYGWRDENFSRILAKEQ
ncbi:MAG: GNAT family N-acetyltransferase [Bacilli bacterium]